jgi:ribonuclease P protein component
LRTGVFQVRLGAGIVSALATNGGVDASDSRTRNRFPRSVRLLRHADFERVYKQGRRHFAAHMTVFYLPRKDSDGDKGGSGNGPGSRIGFTVGKVLGGAVVRNRMKRRLREAVRLHGPIMASVDVVINPKKSMLTTRFDDLQKEISRAFDVIAKSGAKSQR